MIISSSQLLGRGRRWDSIKKRKKVSYNPTGRKKKIKIKGTAMEKIEIELGTSDSIVHTFRYYSERKLRDDVDDSRVIDCHLEFLP